METLRVYTEAMREADERLEAERDRRYAEVNLEREKALLIKETADERALVLQAETQKYKDEKANDLRSQIERERGNYITQSDLKPISDFVQSQIGRTAGQLDATKLLYAVLILIAGAAAAISPHIR